MDMVVHQAKKAIEEDGEEIVSVFFAEKESDCSMNIIMAPWASTQEKQSILNQLRVMFKEMNITRYTHMCEAWASSDMNHHNMGGMPSEDPQRQEVLIVTSVSRGEVRGRTFPIIRDREDKRTLGPQKEMPPGTTLGGEITTLLGNSPKLN